jgi:hypothetical protein
VDKKFRLGVHFVALPESVLGGLTANSQIPTPRWQQLYEAALLETHPQKLTELVRQVEQALMQRSAEIAHSANHSDERNAMVQASENLLVIKTEKLSWPPIKMK